jgi:hypothetical protein
MTYNEEDCTTPCDRCGSLGDPVQDCGAGSLCPQCENTVFGDRDEVLQRDYEREENERRYRY